MNISVSQTAQGEAFLTMLKSVKLQTARLKGSTIFLTALTGVGIPIYMHLSVCSMFLLNIHCIFFRNTPATRRKTLIRQNVWLNWGLRRMTLSPATARKINPWKITEHTDFLREVLKKVRTAGITLISGCSHLLKLLLITSVAPLHVMNS